MKYLKTYEGMYYSDDIKKTIDDILVELIDNGFKYFLNDIREGLTITLEKGDYYDSTSKRTFKKSDIVEPFLMLEDYMKEEWGTDIKISYEYFDYAYSRIKTNTINDIIDKSLIKLKFMCSKQ